MADLELWTRCYLRWSEPAQIQNGGPIIRELQIDHLLRQFGKVFRLYFRQLYLVHDNIFKRESTQLYDTWQFIATCTTFHSFSISSKDNHSAIDNKVIQAGEYASQKIVIR